MTGKNIKLMEVCGTHTMAIARAGIKKALPEGIELISGPGCPVCVTSQKEIDKAIKIAGIKDVIMTTFGDMIRVPGTSSSFEQMRRRGADIRVVYSPLDALNTARENPSKKVVFMGVGFETTTPTVAWAVKEAKKRKIKNFFVLSNFKILFPALRVIASSKEVDVDGFICPGHVSVITGSGPYREFAARYGKPCVITGFEPNDIIGGIKDLVAQSRQGKSKVEIEYKRAVKKEGNRKARRVLDSVFRAADSEWRGLGVIKNSGLKFRKEYKEFDAEREFKVNIPDKRPPKGCLCGQVLMGKKEPKDCRLFGEECTPQKPVGPCMVSSEGTCAAYYKYGE